MSTELTREEQLSSGGDIQFELVPVDEIKPGATIRIRRMNFKGQDAYEKSLIKFSNGGQTQEPDISNKRGKLMVHCICDADGRLHYGPKDVDTLGAKSGAAWDRVYERCVKLNALEKSVEELAKNSNGTPTSDSASD